MSESAVEARGAEELHRTLTAAAEDLADLTEVNDQAGQYVAARAAAAAPRKSGRLAGSLSVVAEPTGLVVESSEIYAAPIHWGWPARNIAAQPFLLDTVEQTEAQILEYYQRNNERVLSSVRGI